MATKLFVARLSFNTTDDSLRELFSQYGTVESAAVITDRDTRRSKGFGFVEMDSEESANAAIKALDGKEFEGREIAVSIAKPRENKPSGGGFGGRQGGGNSFGGSFRTRQ